MNFHKQLSRLDELISARVEGLFERLTGVYTDEEVEVNIAAINELIQAYELKAQGLPRIRNTGDRYEPIRPIRRKAKPKRHGRLHNGGRVLAGH